MTREVVTSENLVQKLETGKVDPPESPEVKTNAEEVKAQTKVEAKVESEDDDKDLTEKVRQKIGAKHRAMKEAEEFAEREYYQRRAAEKRAEELERKLQEVEQKSRPTVVEDEEPKQSDFETPEEYIKAKVKFEVAQERKKEREETERQRIADEAAKTQAEFAKRISKFMKETPDFEEVTSQVDTELPQHMTQFILESELGPQIGYHLSKHTDELNRILKLSPIRAISELGKLEISLQKPVSKEQPKEAPVSKAPAPITPALGNGSGVDKRPEDMNFQEYKAWKDSQRRAGKKV